MCRHLPYPSPAVIPVRARIDAETFLGDAGRVLDEFRAARDESAFILSNETQQSAISSLEDICEKVQTPLQRLEHGLLLWVNFFIMPVFALANAGVAFGGSSLAAALADRDALGIVLGLVVGKTAGIFLFARIAVAAGLAELPNEVRWRDIFGVAMIAGIGFTMALFIASLAFGGSDLLDAAKLGIIAGALISGLGGYLILRTRCPAEQSSDRTGFRSINMFPRWMRAQVTADRRLFNVHTFIAKKSRDLFVAEVLPKQNQDRFSIILRLEAGTPLGSCVCSFRNKRPRSFGMLRKAELRFA